MPPDPISSFSMFFSRSLEPWNVKYLRLGIVWTVVVTKDTISYTSLFPYKSMLRLFNKLLIIPYNYPQWGLQNKLVYVSEKRYYVANSQRWIEVQRKHQHLTIPILQKTLLCPFSWILSHTWPATWKGTICVFSMGQVDTPIWCWKFQYKILISSWVVCIRVHSLMNGKHPSMIQ